MPDSILRPTHWKGIEVGSHGTVQIWLKEALGRRWFWCDKDVKNVVHQWLCAQPKTFYYDGIRKLVGHWEKYAEKQSDM
jgi:hypothetical protein